MVKAKARVTLDPERVIKPAKKAAIENLARAGAYVRGIARKSIKVSPKNSAPGKQPRTRKGRLKNAILYAADKAKSNVVIGPAASDVGKIGHTHEFGGTEPPKAPPAARKHNWKLVVGGHGPIHVDGSQAVVAKLRTAAQVERAKELVPAALEASEIRYVDALLTHWTTGRSKVRSYPPRPFMGPALMVARERLPRLWANSVRG